MPWSRLEKNLKYLAEEYAAEFSVKFLKDSSKLIMEKPSKVFSRKTLKKSRRFLETHLRSYVRIAGTLEKY